MDHVPHILDADRTYQHSLTKMTVDDLDTETKTEFWTPVSTTCSKQVRKREGDIRMRYVMLFFSYTDMSVQLITSQNN